MSFFERFMASYDYVNALHELPPTYTIGETCNFPQFIPDPISPAVLEQRLNAVDIAEKKLAEVSVKK